MLVLLGWMRSRFDLRPCSCVCEFEAVIVTLSIGQEEIVNVGLNLK